MVRLLEHLSIIYFNIADNYVTILIVNAFTTIGTKVKTGHFKMPLLMECTVVGMVIWPRVALGARYHNSSWTSLFLECIMSVHCKNTWLIMYIPISILTRQYRDANDHLKNSEHGKLQNCRPKVQEILVWHDYGQWKQYPQRSLTLDGHMQELMYLELAHAVSNSLNYEHTGKMISPPLYNSIDSFL